VPEQLHAQKLTIDKNFLDGANDVELLPTGQIRYRSPHHRVIGPALVPPQSFDSPLPAIDDFDDLDVGALVGQKTTTKRRLFEQQEQQQQQQKQDVEDQIELPLRGLFSVLVERKSQLRIKEESPENLEYIARRERQRRVENESVNDEIKRYREMSEQMAQVGAGANLPAVRQLLTSFYEPLVVGIEREQSMISEGVPGIDRKVYGPYLQLLGADKIAVISLHTIISMLMRGEERKKNDVFSDAANEHGGQAGSVKFIRLASSLGRVIEAEVNLSRLQMREKLLSARYRAGLINMEDIVETFNQERHEGEQEMIAEREREEKIASIDREIREKNLLKESDMMSTMLQRDSTKKLKTVRAVSEQAKKALDNADWGSVLHLKVGAAIIAIVLDVCKIKVPGPETAETGEKIEVPAFYHDYSLEPNAFRGWKQKASPNNRFGTVHWHDSFFRFVHSATLARARSVITRHKPMIVAPRPWESYNKGGYLNSNSVVMRGNYSREGPSAAQMKLLADRVGEYDNVFGALNVLGSTGWVINTDILEVVEQVWREKKYAGGLGGGIANIPPRAELNLPNWPSSEFRLRRERNGPLYATALPSAKEVGEFMRVLSRTKQTNRELHSQRCDFAIKLEVAREMKNEERIYFPHNVDFRGRAYTMHAHLNHIGSDFCRGTLKFADAKPLGENGLDWLFIQCANLYGGGADKLPLHQRIEFSKLNLENIKKSAEDPLGPEGSWWQDADDPWQCLATCMEINKATNSKDPAKYMCNLPVHQDGSCNGLQHYAALGRDFAGGRAVNLVPADRGADVYTGIANVLRGIVQKDIENCDYKDEQSVERMKLAKLLIDQVDRKLVKQTVMTSVYGVTFVGARMQIQSRLKERVGFENESVRYRVASYAAKRTLDALNDMFQNAREVMGWLTHCASVVTKINAPVQWTTPLGLPVLQPYRNKTQKSVRTLLQTFVLRSEDEKQKVNKSKQRSAFPPNYIHSIDSTHMMMTALECSRANITFAGVHDSFWTHAGDVPVMSRILREKFIELHKAPLLDNLYEELKSTYPEVAGEFLPPPEYGDLDIETVRDSTYFFS
jgi:DNA-directed RNA polymerase